MKLVVTLIATFIFILILTTSSILPITNNVTSTDNTDGISKAIYDKTERKWTKWSECWMFEFNETTIISINFP